MNKPLGNIFHLISEISELLENETALLIQRKDQEAISLLTHKRELIDQFEREIQEILEKGSDQFSQSENKEQLFTLIAHLKDLMHQNDVALSHAKQRREQILNIYVEAVKDQEKPAAFYTNSGQQRATQTSMPAISVIREI